MKITNIKKRESKDLTELTVDNGLISNYQNLNDNVVFRARDGTVAWPGLINGHIHSGNVIGYFKGFAKMEDKSVYDWLETLFKEPFYNIKHEFYKLNLFEKYNYTPEDSASLISNFMFSQGVTSGLLFDYRLKDHGTFKIGNTTSELPRLRIQDGGISVSTFGDLINSPNLYERIEEIKQRKGIFQIHINEGSPNYYFDEIEKLFQLELLDEKTVLIHGLATNQDEYRRIVELGNKSPSVIVCQESNENIYLSTRIPTRLKEYIYSLHSPHELKFIDENYLLKIIPPILRRSNFNHVDPIYLNTIGINTGLGTDSFLSNPNCSLINLACSCVTLNTPQDYINRNYDLFEMITTKNAKVMDLSESIGSLDVGKNGDIILFSDDLLKFHKKPYAVFSNGKLVTGEDCSEIRDFFSKNNIKIETHKNMIFPIESGYLKALEKIKLITDEYNYNIKNTNYSPLIIPYNLSLD